VVCPLLLLSDITVHREQNPERGCYFDSQDPNALAKQMTIAIHQYNEAEETMHQAKAQLGQSVSRAIFAKQYETIAFQVIEKNSSASQQAAITTEKQMMESMHVDKFETDVLLSEGKELRHKGGLRLKNRSKKNHVAKPLITVITVVFNGAEYLEKTIQSVLNQTYDNIEYVIIDGGSTDRTLNIIRKYEEKIDYWVSARDKGTYDAMNKGIRLAQGDWLCFMNAGDLLSNDNTLLDVATALDNKEISFVYSDAELWEPAVNASAGIYICDHRRRILIHQAAVYRKKLHDDFGMYLVAKNVTISDYLFFCLVPDTAFYKVKNPIAIYDIGGVSNSGWARDQQFLVDWLLGRIGKTEFLARIIFYPLRHWYKKRVRYAAALVNRTKAKIALGTDNSNR
jgi:glycosyltransferase involved in cell wall biosynthesis